MKSIDSILQKNQPNQNIGGDTVYIDLLLRRGTTTAVSLPRLASEMICQDCGGNNGHTWSQNGKKLWFCANSHCLKTDTQITKQRERMEWREKHQLALKKAEEQKAKKKWDGT